MRRGESTGARSRGLQTELCPARSILGNAPVSARRAGMTGTVPPKRIFPTSKVDAQSAKHVPSSPQTESAAYKLAFQDTDFLLREDLRPVRFQLELLKPELFLDEARIGSTIVFYGSARIPEPAEA